MTMYAKRKGWPLQGARIEATLHSSAAPGEAPRIVQAIALEGPLTDEQRARLKEVAGKCPVHKILQGPTVIEERFA
jgi:putative redox protein